MLSKMMIATSLAASMVLTGCTSSMPNPSTERHLAKLQNKNWVMTEINQVKYKADPVLSAVPVMAATNLWEAMLYKIPKLNFPI